MAAAATGVVVAAVVDWTEVEVAFVVLAGCVEVADCAQAVNTKMITSANVRNKNLKVFIYPSSLMNSDKLNFHNPYSNLKFIYIAVWA
jgi:hypothetical protein